METMEDLLTTETVLARGVAVLKVLVPNKSHRLIPDEILIPLGAFVTSKVTGRDEEYAFVLTWCMEAAYRAGLDADAAADALRVSCMSPDTARAVVAAGGKRLGITVCAWCGAKYHPGPSSGQSVDGSAAEPAEG